MCSLTTCEPSTALASGCTVLVSQVLSARASGQVTVAGGSIKTFGSLPIDLTRIGAGAPQMPSLLIARQHRRLRHRTLHARGVAVRQRGDLVGLRPCIDGKRHQKRKSEPSDAFRRHPNSSCLHSRSLWFRRLSASCPGPFKAEPFLGSALSFQGRAFSRQNLFKPSLR